MARLNEKLLEEGSFSIKRLKRNVNVEAPRPVLRGWVAVFPEAIVRHHTHTPLTSLARGAHGVTPSQPFLDPQVCMALAVRRNLSNIGARDLGAVCLEPVSHQSVNRSEVICASAISAAAQSWHRDIEMALDLEAALIHARAAQLAIDEEGGFSCARSLVECARIPGFVPGFIPLA